MSVQFGPLDHYSGILERANGLIDLQIRTRPLVSGFRLWASLHPHHLYGTRIDAGAGLDGAAPVASDFARTLLLRGGPGKFITSSSIPLGRWSTTSKVTLYFRISLAMVPKIVCEATSGVRNLWASSIVMTSGLGSLLAPPEACSFRRTYLW